MPIVFHNVSRLKFFAIRARLRAQAERMEWTDNTVLASGDGLATDWSYDEAAQSLTVVYSKPWWRSDGYVTAKVQGLVESI